ncbi:kinesin light chain 1 [Xylaria sp. FL0043]|nr:kinesin light chain 1 [Xylaria sp. FL0043]
MRFLELQDDGRLGLTEDLASGFPPYAILSHTWGPDNQEVTYEDIKTGKGEDKDGYRKIRFCADLAARDRLKHFWVDTCCIDKANHTELSEAITSMFRWYKHSAKCYVYLSDVVKGSSDQSNWKDDFRASRWFTRGWTLQELVAPGSIDFYSADCQRLGDKKSLERLIHDITGIPISALQGTPLDEFSDVKLMSWSDNRQTKKEEDLAYCLLGIFRVHMPLIYGEGRESALRRLREEIDKRSGTRGEPFLIPRSTQDNSHFMVPLEWNEDFVGREAILEQLLDLIPPSINEDVCQRTIIEGLGGVGKTQLALEAAHRVRRAYRTCSIFWVPALSATSFENAYREIGRLLGTKGIDGNGADAKSLVKAALSHENVNNWLLIIDNVDDLKLLEEISGYFPFNRRGSILFTTRNHGVGIRLDIRQKNTISLGELSDAEATGMLQNGLKESQVGGTNNTIRLLQFLSNLPLAIKQASAYMANTGMTTQQYLSHCESSDKTLSKLLSKDFEDRGRYKTGGSNPIATTWLITFEHIQRDYPTAARYLKFLCFLAEKDIPVSLLPPEEDELARDEAIGILKGYAIITEREEPDSFDIHRLVRLAMRNWLECQGDLADHVTFALQNLLYEFPDPGETWEERKVWTRLLPHVQTALELQSHCADEDTRAQLLYRLGRCNYLLGKYAIAELLFQQSLEIELRVNGPDHQSTRYTLSEIAHALLEQRKYDEAESIYRQIAEAGERILGKEDPETLSSLYNIAEVLRRRGEYEEAERIHRQVMEAEERVLGKEHPDTLMTLYNLAGVLQVKGEYEEAERIYRQVMKAEERVLSEEHPSALATLHNLADVLRMKGEYEEAEKIARQVTEAEERVLGKEHPDTLTTLCSLAVVLEKKGEYEEAEKIYWRVVEAREKVLGEEHPSTLTTLHNFAPMLENKGEYKEAEKFYRRVIEAREKVLGKEHRDTLRTSYFLADMLAKRGRYEEAEQIFQQVLGVRRRVLGKDHPDTLEVERDLSELLCAKRDRSRQQDENIEDEEAEYEEGKGEGEKEGNEARRDKEKGKETLRRSLLKRMVHRLRR